MNVVHTLRSLLAIGAGFLTLALLVSLATALMRRFAPQWTIPYQTEEGDTGQQESGTRTADPRGAGRTGMAVNLATGILFGALGGAATAWFAPDRPLIHALMLSLVVLILSAVAAHDVGRRTTAMYALALLALTPMAVLGGGILVTLLR